MTDVRTTAPLQPIEVLCGGFPCQDLSVAGKGAGLAGAKSGLFFELARVARKLRPKLIIMENVPAVRKYRTVIEDALHEYGFRWITFSATTAGAPHPPRRGLIVAGGGATSRPDLDLVVTPKLWAADQAARLWPTPTAANPNEGEDLTSWYARRDRLVARGLPPISPPLAVAVKAAADQPGDRLNPEWVEALMGFPAGWTEPIGDSMRDLLLPTRWPRPRPPADHQGPWPGYAWEPSRTITGRPQPGRPARLKQLGNAVVPQAALAALKESRP